MTTTLGISLKAYFGYEETLHWARRLRAILDDPRPGLELFVLPSHPAIAGVIEVLAGTGVGVGAQNMTSDDSGAQTGEVTGATLADMGCQYVAIGHAERRARFGETDAVVAAKLAAAFRHGLTPILCVGETHRRSSAQAATDCIQQIESALGQTGRRHPADRIVVAYEPIWAIGQAEPAPEDHILAVIEGLRAATGVETFIYGGSAQPGLLTGLGSVVDGLFLGRFAHDPAALAAVLDEAATVNATMHGAMR